LAKLELERLPKLNLQQRDHLPPCPAIYFALDDQGRVLYIGQAQNLAQRWRGTSHHRIEQLKNIHRRHSVTLAWLDCSDCPHQLDALEATYIDTFNPLLNGTQVPSAKVIPAEVILQRSLEKIAKYGVIFGLVPIADKGLPMIVLKYLGWGRTANNLSRSLQSLSHKPSSLYWSEFIRRKHASWWKARCNGFIFQLGPWPELPGNSPVTSSVAEDPNLRPLAGIPMATLKRDFLQQLLSENPRLAENYPGLVPYETDPVPLLWQGFSVKR
jgi:predicted GIY-YIG superfamily endonuclease